MYAQCPECLTFFRVRPEQLKAASGQVRCSQCKQVFNALETLRGDLSAEELRAVSEARRASDAAAEAPLLREDSNGDLFRNLEFTANEELPLEEAGGDRARLEEPTGHTERMEEHFDHLPGTDFTRRRRHPAVTALLLLANLALLSLLAAQYLHHERRQFLVHPEIGPLLTQAYERIGYAVAPPRDLAAIRITRTNVASHPDFERSLKLTAVAENRADFAQPWPEVRIDLQDRWGDTVGARYFTAREYLREPARADALMPPGEAQAIELAILDPGSEAVGFQVDACISKASRKICSSDLGR